MGLSKGLGSNYISFSPFCTELVTGLVKWLHLSEAVLPTMTAFASGLGGEEADIFAQTLLKDPILKGDPSAVTQVRWPLGGDSAIYNSILSGSNSLFWAPRALHTGM